VTYSILGERNANDTELCFVVYKRIKSRVTHPASQLWLHTSVIQPGKGGIVTHVLGEVLASGGAGEKSRYFSADEITHPGLENGNVMVATKVEIEKQKRGTCTDPKMSCSSAADCTPGVGAICDAGQCKEPSWCPDGKELTSKFDLETGSVGIWVKSSIQFLNLKPDRLFISQVSKLIQYPAEGANVYTVNDLLKLLR